MPVAAQKIVSPKPRGPTSPYSTLLFAAHLTLFPKCCSQNSMPQRKQCATGAEAVVCVSLVVHPLVPTPSSAVGSHFAHSNASSEKCAGWLQPSSRKTCL